ncbi:MAG: glutathione S-transferase C-terminal domain-containing protein [Pseudomonadota bacterium]
MLTLAISDRCYSSWSLRGHLLAELSGLPFRTRHARLRSDAFAAMAQDFGPARTVPMLAVDGPAGVIRHWDSLAIAETLHELAPDAGIWPRDPAARAAARTLCAEMHAGFGALRGDCPMALDSRYEGYAPSEAVLADVARIEELWAWARKAWPGEGPWLFGGDFTAADAFYAPVASRFVTYGLGGPEAEAYAAAVYAHPPFRRWRAMGVAEGYSSDRYEKDLPQRPRFGPAPRPARAVEGAAPSNALCPYSGKPAAADGLAEIDGRVIGFCNPFCRDKSAADADAWPELAPLLP